MEHGFHNSSLTVAVAMVVGVFAQSIARWVQLPGIVILLGVGVLLGPDVANVIDPSSLGDGMQTLVGFAVAIVLFEGGMALNVRRLLRAQLAVRRLVTVGAVVSLIGGTIVAYFIMGFDLKRSILFGTLVIVTGPTVITPLLRRLNVEHRTSTVLEAEGVLIDAVGAITAAVALEVALSPSQVQLSTGLIELGGGLAIGTAIGALAGLALMVVLGRGFVASGLENILTLAAALAVFQFSNAIVHESGIAAVTVAGIVVGAAKLEVHRDLHEFKEQLTTLVIGMLFVLLAASVRISDVEALGMPGVFAVLAMIFIVRPVNVFAATVGTTLNWKQKAFMGWIGPRGIIAAAVAALFASRLEAAGQPGGKELQALVFLIIAATVLSAGLTGGIVAKLLGLGRKSNDGWVVLGGNELALEMGKELMGLGQTVVMIESDARNTQTASDAGLKVVFGNPLVERTLHRAQIESREGAIGVTASEEGNLLFAQRAKREGKVSKLLVALDSLDRGVTEEMLVKIGAEVLFGRATAVDLWSVRLRQKTASASWWHLKPSDDSEPLEVGKIGEGNLALPLVKGEDKHFKPCTSGSKIVHGEEVRILIATEKQAKALEHLEALGLERIIPAAAAN